MDIRIKEETVKVLEEYSHVSIAFRVERRFQVEAVNNSLEGFILTEEQVEQAYIKDYDYDEKPIDWSNRWDISHWGVFSAFDGNRRVGGAIVAHDTEGVLMLEGRKDSAVLWDIRVHPNYRRMGIGVQMVCRAVEWARKRHCREIKVETQNINVPACRFYAKQGFELGAIIKNAYAEYPDEIQLNWYKKIR